MRATSFGAIIHPEIRTVVPDIIIGPRKMRVFTWGLIGVEQTGRFVEILFYAASCFFIVAKIDANKVPCAVGGATPQTPRRSTIQQDSYGGNLHK